MTTPTSPRSGLRSSSFQLSVTRRSMQRLSSSHARASSTWRCRLQLEVVSRSRSSSFLCWSWLDGVWANRSPFSSILWRLLYVYHLMLLRLSPMLTSSRSDFVLLCPPRQVLYRGWKESLDEWPCPHLSVRHDRPGLLGVPRPSQADPRITHPLYRLKRDFEPFVKVTSVGKAEATFPVFSSLYSGVPEVMILRQALQRALRDHPFWHPRVS